ncbi:MAG: TonB-dependent receptor [Bacteroidota bacterium]
MSPTRTLLAALLLLLLGASPAIAQTTGTLTGRVTDAGSGQLLPGATVRVDGTQLGAATDAFGKFTIRAVPAGQVTLIASFIGYNDAQATATVEAGASVYVELELTENTAQLAEVVVKSEKFVRNLQETQTSVNVVGAAELEAIPVRDWEDATRLVGNLSTSGNGVFTIRGIPNTGVGGGSGPTAALYVDGVQQGRFGTFRTIRGAWDLEAVEVFRGPQSTLSGRNSLAGAVYLRSAAPSFEWGGAARVRGGSQDAIEGAFMVTGPLIDDQLAFRVSGELGTQDEGFRYVNVSSDDPDFDRTTQVDQRNLKSRLLFTPKALPGFSLLASYTYAFDRPGNPIVTATAGTVDDPDFSARENLGPIAFYDETYHHSSSMEASYEVSPALTLTSLTAYSAMDLGTDGLRFQATDPNLIIPSSQTSDIDETTFTQELRLNYETDRTRAVFGGYFGRFYTDRLNNDLGDIFALAEAPLADFFGGPVPPFGIIYGATSVQETEAINLAAFGEINYEVVDGLTLTAGLRYDNEDFESTLTVTDIGVTFESTPDFVVPFEPLMETLLLSEVGAADEAVGTDFSAWLPKVGVKYDLTRDASVGVTVQRGYRAGGAFSVVGAGLNSYDPEYTWNYEIALRSRWLGGRLLANANVFYTDWRDQQVTVPFADNPAFFETVNAGASTLYGGEIELRAVPTNGLTLYGSLGLTESEFDTFVRPERVLDRRDNSAVTIDRDLSGLQFPGAPNTTLAFGAILDRGTGPFLGLNINYTGENYTQVGTLPGDQAIVENASVPVENDERLRAGDYWMFDGQVGYVLGVRGTELRLTAFARNVFDTLVTDRRFINIAGGIDANIREARVLGLSLDVKL